jgi:hypothetical protein
MGDTMINVPVDEAYAFDMLSIMEIKAQKSPDTADGFKKFLSVIRAQLGDELTTDIRISKPYIDLLEANGLVFDLVERMDQGSEVSGNLVHSLNMKRFHAKRQLQFVFFGQELAERKTVK